MFDGHFHKALHESPSSDRFRSNSGIVGEAAAVLRLTSRCALHIARIFTKRRVIAS
jgi:hypothetical protein